MSSRREIVFEAINQELYASGVGEDVLPFVVADRLTDAALAAIDATDIDAAMNEFANVNIMVAANGSYTKSGKYMVEFSHDDGHEIGSGDTMTAAILAACAAAKAAKEGDSK